MNRKTSISLAYYLVTTGFTIGLFGLVFILGNLFSNGDVNAVINVDLNSSHDISTIRYDRDALWQYNEDSSLQEDVVRKYPYDIGSIVQLPVHYLRESHPFEYYFFVLRFLIEYISWLYIAYQAFLILYDVKRKKVFIAANTRRMRKMGYIFLMLFVLFTVSLEYRGSLSPGNGLYIWSDTSIKVIGNYTMYLLIASLVFVFASVFHEGKQLKEEGELTI